MKNFNAKEWSINNSTAKSLGAESLKVAEILAYLRKEKGATENIDKLLVEAINKVTELGFDSGD